MPFLRKDLQERSVVLEFGLVLVRLPQISNIPNVLQL